MTTRHNLCTNPALSVDNTGWGGNGTAPARTAVSGFQRPYAARYVDGTFIRTPTGLVTEGLTYTLSIDIRPTSDVSSGHIYIEWQRSDSSVIQYTTVAYGALTGGAVTRLSVTDTTPIDGTVYQACIIVDGPDFTTNTTDFAAALIEQDTQLDPYFDGDTPGASWDGTAGESTSTFVVPLPPPPPMVVSDGGRSFRRRAATAFENIVTFGTVLDTAPAPVDVTASTTAGGTITAGRVDPATVTATTTSVATVTADRLDRADATVSTTMVTAITAGSSNSAHTTLSTVVHATITAAVYRVSDITVEVGPTTVLQRATVAGTRQQWNVGPTTTDRSP